MEPDLLSVGDMMVDKTWEGPCLHEIFILVGLMQQVD